MIMISSAGCHLYRWWVYFREGYYPKAHFWHYSHRNWSTWMAAQHCARLVFWSLVRSAVSNLHILL